MNVQFITQGFLSEGSRSSGDVIIEALQSGNYNSFLGFTAFVGSGGVTNLKEQLISFISEGNEVQLFIGVDLHGTSKEALDMLLEANIPTKVVHSPNSIVYHPKVYLFRGEIDRLIIVGSSNLTTSGLFQNIEASICLSYTSEDSDGVAVEESILKSFKDIIDGSSSSVQTLDNTLIDILVNSNVVLPEKVSREISNNSLPKTTCENSNKLKEKFKKIKLSKPPKGFKKTIKSEVVIPSQDRDDKTIVMHITSEIEGRSMWIESGRMTGGSRNILDLSKQGKRNGQLKFGSVEFFGINKDNYTEEKDIILIYNNKEYVSNTIKYAPKNSNWRIQLKGKTTEEDPITDVLKANGSQNKVFIFETTESLDKYNFYIMDIEDISMLKDMSSDWAAGGKGGNGRQYGIIND